MYDIGNLSLKYLFSTIAIFLTFIGFIPYIRSILLHHAKPHVFSWIIWGITTTIVFFAQIADDAGTGAWSIGLSGLITLGIAWIAYQRKADITITRSDWIFFGISLGSLPLWYLTSNPVTAVILLTTIDVIAFLPTLRKAYHHPWDEPLIFYSIITIRNFISLLALENYSIATILFPLVMGIACLIFIGIVLFRRNQATSQNR